ncbi:MAG: MG2 domain-containing protein [Burkholderiales bacterium]
MGLVRSLVCALVVAVSPASFAATVEFFAPQGEVKGIRQVTARFSEPMAPLGDPRLSEPFDIECPEKGSGRWAGPKHWVFDFEHDLPAGVRCRFSVRTGVTSEAGTAIEAARFEFTTGGPAIVEQFPREGSRIDEEQTFVLGLNTHATAESVLANAWCDVKGINEKIGVKLVEGKDREVILNGRGEFLNRFQRLFQSGSRMDRSPKDPNDLPLMILQCKRRFPNGAEVKMVWGKGIVSRSGVATNQEQSLAYVVRPEFRARFTCERANAKAGCMPIAPMRLSFTAPVARKQLQLIVLRDSANRVYKPLQPEATGEFAEGIGFNAPFPEHASFKLEIPPGLRDDAGRKLANAANFPLSVSTDEAPPLAKFAATFGIIESQAGGEMPITLRTIENPALAKTIKADTQGGKSIPGKALNVRTDSAGEIIGWLRRIQHSSRDEWVRDSKDGTEVRRPAGSHTVFAATDKTRALSIPKPEGAKAFEVIGIPLKGTGLHIVEIASPKLGAALLAEPPKESAKSVAAQVYYAPAAALVTNLSVHFKQGRESSLVWVTRLHDGRPAAKVAVSVQDCQGREYWKGSTSVSGIALIKSELPNRERLPVCLESSDHQYVVVARDGNDMSFVLSGWNEGIARWRFNLPRGDWSGLQVANTVFDRTLVRVGDTVHMKHFYRERVGQGFAFAKAGALPASAKIRHRGSEQTIDVPVQWDGRATAESQWKVPEGAKTGTYEVVFEDALGERGVKTHRVAGRFRVEEFRMPTMRAFVQPPAAPQVNVDRVPLGVQVSNLSGGGASNQTVKVRGMVQPRSVFFSGYEGFAWAAPRVREGIERSGAWRWMSGEYEAEEEGVEETPRDSGRDGQRRTLRQVSLTLDSAGTGKAELAGVPLAETPQELLAEMEYANAGGEILTAATRIALWPSALVLGIKTGSWAVSKEQLKFQVVALDLQGNPVPQSKVSVDLFQRLHYTHRKRLAGGFHGYESGQEVKRLTTVCEGTTDEKGRLFCEAHSPVDGEVILQAQSMDAQGRASVTQTSVWVADKADWWFGVSNDDRMDVIPERKRYEPGEKALFQVRMPFREATALVTVEREGVMEAFVRTLSSKSPVISVPMAGHYAPNVFVSVLVVRGRMAGVQPAALADLGKPSFKMGVAEVQVGWKAHEMKVSVATDRQTYKARDKVKVEIEAARALDGKPEKGAEAILAAVDEGLLELAPNESWKLLDAMMQRRGIEVDTATASMQVVGKRYYGRKALPPGGGGGRQSSRELFDPLLFWKVRVKLDDQGRASAEIPLNDSLTSFRIVVVVDAGAGLFGTGYTSMRHLQLISGLPPLVRE